VDWRRRRVEPRKSSQKKPTSWRVFTGYMCCLRAEQ